MRQEIRSWGLGLVLLACAGWGCESQTYKPLPVTPVSSARLLKTKPSQLQPVVRFGQRSRSRVELAQVKQVQIQYKSRGKRKRYTLYRDGKDWWLVQILSETRARGRKLRDSAMLSMFQSMKELKPLERAELDPERADVQVALFSQGSRFLLRMMRAPVERKLGSLYHGEWLVYHHGDLYQQAKDGALSQSFRRLRRRLQRLSRRGGWMMLPERGWEMDYRFARRAASELSTLRKGLKRCFKKKRFPASIGALRIRMSFSPLGKVKKMKILTKAHRKHSLVWCVWWFAKRWQIKPNLARPSAFSYQLVLPSSGP